ncbi:unnamed protein product [Prorocentrum cordatum]|uniref:Subtilisin n=1 Tax=Prorocentrum cordatum TaxID=2364126 RepID=A0ABN9T3E3_9DINO|nr:unnamed protein product [Polarella glacialis]
MGPIPVVPQLWGRRKKRRPLDGFATKTFVTSINTYDFGPLLAGRDPESRVGAANARGPAAGAFDAGGAGDGEAKPGSAGREPKQDKFLLGHAGASARGASSQGAGEGGYVLFFENVWEGGIRYEAQAALGLTSSGDSPRTRPALMTVSSWRSAG